MITSETYFAAMTEKRGKKDAAFHHNVYVIELDPKVLKNRAFRKANPNYQAGQRCFYVGCTGMSPEMRFLNHQRGYKSNRYAHKYGLRLRHDLFTCYNPMPYEGAIEMEKELAAALRNDGHAVWQN